MSSKQPPAQAFSFCALTSFCFSQSQDPTLTKCRLDSSFKGRVQRGSQIPATWAEFQVAATNGGAWGDISLEQGYDGPALIGPTDHVNTGWGGFTNDAFQGAPAAAYQNKSDGPALGSTLGNGVCIADFWAKKVLS
jgi:hypothetical protein